LAKKYKIDQLPLVKTAQTQIADGQFKNMNIYKISLYIQNLEIETFVSVIDGNVELATVGTAFLRLFDFSIINGECCLKFK
jgi:predicted aspartyl protease